MSISAPASAPAYDNEFHFPSERPLVRVPSQSTLVRDTREQMQRDALTDKLRGLRTRVEAMREQNDGPLLRQDSQSKELEHRIFNGLQLIASLLSSQSRTATPEAASQLTIAAGRIIAFGSVHRRLHILDHQDTVELRQHLQHLCADLTDLLFQGTGRTIIVLGESFELPTKFGIPLGFIVNELVTNAAKYAKGNITVRFETMSATSHSLSVVDDGPGLPADFDPAGKGLGMKIVLSLVKQIRGEFHTGPGDNGSGGRCTVTFRACRSAPMEIYAPGCNPMVDQKVAEPQPEGSDRQARATLRRQPLIADCRSPPLDQTDLMLRSCIRLRVFD